MKKKICVVTGSRAEYGLLYWVMREIKNCPDLQLQVAVTGMHLSPEFGMTINTLLQDGFTADAKVEMLLSSDSALGVTKSVGLGVIGFADEFARLKPDWVLLLGDRFEIFAAAQAAYLAKIPIAHIAGGDITEGAFDEAIRHSITKMTHLHLVTNEPAKRRVLQLGEDPSQVFVVGSPGLDHLKRTPLLSKEALCADLGITFAEHNALITFHPATLEAISPTAQLQELLQAIDTLGSKWKFFFTLPNADTGGRELIAHVQQFVRERPEAYAFTSLGQIRYLSLMQAVDVVIGNSSSGLYEAPSLQKPTVNIGHRQTGRLKATSVIDCEPKMQAILAAIQKALLLDCTKVMNPYGDGESSKRIVELLQKTTLASLEKTFFEVGMSDEL